MYEKKRIIQINVVCNSGSTGRIAEEIGCLVIKSGFESYIAYGRGDRFSNSYTIRIGSDFNLYIDAVQSRLLDNHGLASVQSTRDFIAEIQSIKPDLIHLHNIHGYYLNYPILFDCLKELDIPIVWTLHDCWSFTGHCTYFTAVKCDKWKTGCYHCAQKKIYPASLFLDKSKRNYELKKQVFNSIPKLTIVSVSDWLNSCVQRSFLRSHQLKVIKNGVDISVFRPYTLSEFKDKNSLDNKFVAISLATTWTERKGLSFYKDISAKLNRDEVLILVGLTEKQIKHLPSNIIGVKRTEDREELVALYSRADVCLNLSIEETFGLTTVEAMACGTPGIVFNSTASPELITSETGFIHEVGDIDGVLRSMREIKNKGKDHYMNACRDRAVKHFNKDDRYQEYIDLYKSLLNKK